MGRNHHSAKLGPELRTRQVMLASSRLAGVLPRGSARLRKMRLILQVPSVTRYLLRTGVILALLLLLTPGSATGQEQEMAPAPEYKIKAGFLLNFTRYVTWPERSFSGPRSPIIIGILGRDPFGDIIDETIGGRTSQSRPVTIRRFRSVSDITDCHLLFISNAERRRQKTYLAELSGRPILTVGENESFLEAGGGINLVRIRDNIKFEVNLEGTRSVGIRISSRILTLAINKDEL